MTEIETIFLKTSSDRTWYCTQTIDIPNRAINYGDGLFETMVWDADHIRFFDKHINRLTEGMEVLGLDFSMIDLKELISFLTLKFPNERKRIRWSIFRAGAGKYTPEESAVIQVLQITQTTLVSSVKKHADVSQDVKLFASRWSKFKTLNSLPYIMANKEKRDRGLDEIIILDHRGYISEASIANIFWVKSGTYFTPSLSCGCINGVSRQVLIEYFNQNKIPIEIGEFEIESLLAADQIFVSNSSGFSYLESFKGKSFLTEPPAFLLQIFH